MFLVNQHSLVSHEHCQSIFDFYINFPLLDLDFNATSLSLNLNAEIVEYNTAITVSVYNDGVAEDEEGFVVLFGVLQEELDSRDVGFVNVLTPAVLVRLQQGGKDRALH